MKRYKTVDEFIEGQDQWRAEVIRLREILNSMPLEEVVKWGAPCYVAHGQRVVGIGSFKSYFGLWFFQGGLLGDKDSQLENAQEGRTKAMRQWRMQSKKDIKVRTIKAYVKEAIALAEAGKAIKPDRSPKQLVIPPELEKAFGKNKKAYSAFADLTPGKQREYADYITDAKRADTKLKRIEKILPMIKQGVGLNDKYRSS